MSYVSKNPRFNSQILTDQGTNSVDDPASGSHKVVNRNGLLYMRDSSGNETAIGSAGATGGINYIDNPSAETGTDGWATYADAAGTTPVDGTGGSANVTLTRTTTAGEILRGDASFELTVDAANRQGEGFSYDFTIDKADQNKVLGIWFDVDATDANYVDDDLQVFIYDKDQSQLITPTSPTNGYKIKGNQYRHRVAFAPYDTSSNDYRLIIHVASTNASGYSVRFDNFEVGPGAIMTGFDGIWKTYTDADVTWTCSDTNYTLQNAWLQPYKDTSGDWRLRFNALFSSGTAAGAGLTFTLTGVTAASLVDEGQALTCNIMTDGGGGLGRSNSIEQCTWTSNSSNINLETDGASSFNDVAISGDIQLSSKPTWADFDPIATIYPSTEDLALSGWQSYTPTNTQGFGTITSNLQWRRNGQNVEIQGRFTAGTVSASEAQIELPNSYTISFASSTSGEVRVGTISRDFAGDPSIGSVLGTEGDTFLNIGRFSRTVDINTLTPINGSQFISNSQSVSLFASVPVAEFADLGQVPPIGLELASDTQYGLVKGGQVPGITDASTIASGYLGEVIEETRLAASAIGLTTSTVANVTSTALTLTPGKWVIEANVGLTGSATAVGTIIVGISTTSATLPGADDRGFSLNSGHDLSGSDAMVPVRSKIVNISSNTTYYLVIFTTFPSGTCSAYGKISGRRIG